MKKSYKLFFLLFLFIQVSDFAKAQQSETGTRFIVAGHIYPIIKDVERLNKFAEKINSYKPDYVFLLGDSDLQNEDSFRYLNTIFDSKLYFSPGNNELRISRKQYEKNVGYLDKVILEKDIRFILLNSSESKENISKYLKDVLKEPFQNGDTIILTHHRIWDDTIIDEKSYQHDKSYYFKYLFPILNGKVSTIFSGNSKRQYFRDLTYSVSYGKQNVNSIYWLDKIGDINAYAVGMGDGVPKASFVVVDVMQKKLIVAGDYSSLENYKTLPKKMIAYNKNRLSLEHTSDLKKFVSSKYYLVKKNKVWKGLIFLIIFTIISIFVYRKIRNRGSK
mgnify:CR=1 FL=1